ncbi:MAG: hypothetical protein ACP6IS_00945 [Candidatus Asgardarchaeia archaeon]
MSVPKELKIEFTKRLAQIFIIGNLVLYFLLFALFYSLLYTNLLIALIKTINGLIWALLIEGLFFIILGIVTKNKDYSFMITPKRRSPLSFKEEKSVMDLLDDPEIFNGMVIFTKQLLIYVGLLLVVVATLYIIIIGSI